MSDQNNDNPIVAWAKERPLWEKYIWKVCLETGTLNHNQIDTAYRYLLIDAGVEPNENSLPEISLDGLVPPESDLLLPIRLKTLSCLKNVNALPEDQEIIFHEKLTLIYGGNGTGKSGYGRLFSKACFSRANKTILPNLTKEETQGPAEATFTFHDGIPNRFVDNGIHIEALKRFSVFDSDCVPIYIDSANSLQFTPGQLLVFDKVNQYIHELEAKFNAEKTSKRVTNPIPLIFQSEQASSVYSFLSGINHLTSIEEIDKNISFKEEDKSKLQELEKERYELIKLDHSKKKKELIEYCQYLNNFRTHIEEYLENFDENRILLLNGIVKDVLDRKQLVAQLGSSQFDTGVLKTVGSEKWKALLLAANELSEAEKSAGSSLDKCILCHQDLRESEKSLFKEYWKFLASTAESDLKIAGSKLQSEIRAIELLRTKLPIVNNESIGIRTLSSEDPDFVEYLKDEIQKISSLADSWIQSLNKCAGFGTTGLVKIDWTKIESIIKSKVNEESVLVDPSDKIRIADTELLTLKHKVKASASRPEIISYWNYLIWESMANKVTFPKNKYTTARKVFFNEILSEKYRQTFNEEVAALDGHEGLYITTSGRSGDTVIKLGLRINRLKDVLSEGEQKVSALADFLTEVRVDRNNCGIIFDDPVTSLDHERKEKIAQRLVEESKVRQVIIFTHDIVFLNKIFKNAIQREIDFFSHWITKSEDGLFGIVEVNSNPRLSNLSALKKESQDAVANFRNMTSKQKESAISLASNHLRSGCEALIREKLFLNSMERYDDKVSIQILEEMPLDRDLIIKVIELHGRLSEIGSMHDRSDEMRESPIDRDPFDLVFQEFCILEKKFTEARGTAKNERKQRQSGLVKSSQSWSGKV